MGRWASRRRTQTCLTAAIAVAALGAELCWKDPTPRLAARLWADRPRRTQSPQAHNFIPAEKYAQASPAAASEPAAEAFADEDLRDAVASERPALGPIRWKDNPEWQSRPQPSDRLVERFRAGPAAAATAPRQMKRADAASLPQFRPESPLPKRASPGFASPNRASRAPAHRPEPMPLAQQLRREAQMLRAARQSASHEAREASGGRFSRHGAYGGARSSSLAQGAAKKEKESEEEKQKRARRPGKPRFHPVLLSKLLGRKPLRPPTGRAEPPKDNPWTLPIPEQRDDGAPVAPEAPTLLALETESPPGRLDAACREAGPHWHAEGDAHYYHDGTRWGLSEDGRWSWLERKGAQWWVWPDKDSPPLLWHQEHWWVQNQGAWYLLHDGEPWGYRFLSEFKQEGFIHPGTDVKMIYSQDGGRVGMVTPGLGETIFDAQTGEPLGRVPEDKTPKPTRPKPIEGLPINYAHYFD